MNGWNSMDRGLVRSGLDRLFLRRQATFWSRRLRPLWSRTDGRAEVVEIVDETHDTKTFWLRPPRSWAGHDAGQFVTVTCEVNGVATRRCYSLSSRPGEALVAITIKRVEGGLMSPWLHERVHVGDHLALSPASGDFTAPSATRAPLLFLTGGSGITPAMAILRDLTARGALPDTVFIHHARSPRDLAFADELRALAASHRQLSLHLLTDDVDGFFDEATFTALAPDFAARETYLCGPAPLMDRAAGLWDGGYTHTRLHAERFALPTTVATREAVGTPTQATLATSGRTLSLNGAGTLLEQLEQGGATPAHGCRIGICHTCKCIKRAGSVQNLLTGAISDAPNQLIQLCISRPRGDITLDL